MKKTKIVLIIAGALIVLGVALVLLAIALGAKPLAYFQNGVFNIGYTVGDSNYHTIDNEFSDSGEYILPADSVQSLAVDWSTGKVEVFLSDTDEIRLSETSNETITGQTALRYEVNNGLLHIQYVNKGVLKAPGKDLKIYLPRTLYQSMSSFAFYSGSADMVADEINTDSFRFESGSGGVKIGVLVATSAEIDTASGEVTVGGRVNYVDVDTSSGDVELACTGYAVEVDTSTGSVCISGAVDQCEVETASGDVELACTGDAVKVDTSTGSVCISGAVDQCEVETASGDVTMALTTAPVELSANTSSGGVNITLPENADFALEMDTASGSFNSDFSLKKKGNTYISGTGAGVYKIDTASGDITLNAKH